MKSFTMLLALTLASSLAFANNFKAEDFNQMIQENQKSEAELRKNLQKGAGIQFEDQPGRIAREKLEIPTEAEQVVVSTHLPDWKPIQNPALKAQDKARMKRLSQELDEAR